MRKGKDKQKTSTNAELFTVDEAGDEGLRRQLWASTWDHPAAAHPRRGSGRPLRSEEILAQRSRVPARTSKVALGLMGQRKKELERRMKITPGLKKRLRGMIKRDKVNDRGLWDVPVSRELQLENLAISKGDQDIWSANASTSLPKSLQATQSEIMAIVESPAARPPPTLHTHHLLSSSTMIYPSIPRPHPGESYNPTFDDHQALLAAEHAKVWQDEEESQKLQKVKEIIMDGGATHRNSWETGYTDEVGSGDDGEIGQVETQQGQVDSSTLVKRPKVTSRKTDKEKRRKQLNRVREAYIRAQSRSTKLQRHALSNLSLIASAIDTSSAISTSQVQKRRAMLGQKLEATGLSDLRSGPARVPKPKQAFLLSEELPESLRQLKMDGNLWKDWIDSSRRRGRIQTERRPYGRMMKQKGRGHKAFEKVKWRKFDK